MKIVVNIGIKVTFKGNISKLILVWSLPGLIPEVIWFPSYLLIFSMFHIEGHTTNLLIVSTTICISIEGKPLVSINM